MKTQSHGQLRLIVQFQPTGRPKADAIIVAAGDTILGWLELDQVRNALNEVADIDSGKVQPNVPGETPKGEPLRIRPGMFSDHDENYEHWPKTKEGCPKLFCHDSDADKFIAAGLLREEDIVRIKPLPKI